MLKNRMLVVSILLSVFCCPFMSHAQSDEAAMMATARGHYQEGGYYYASTWLERILKKWPDTAQREEVLVMMAKSYAATGREDKAERVVRTLLKDYPQAASKLDQDVLKLAQEPDAGTPPLPALHAVEAPAPVLATPAVAQKEQLPEVAVTPSAGGVKLPVLAQPAASAQAVPDAAKQITSAAPAEPAAAKSPDEVKAPVAADAPTKREGATPAVVKDAAPAVAEGAKPAVTKDVAPAVAEDVASAEVAKTAVTEVAKPAVTKDVAPAVAEVAKPAVAEAAKPAVAEAAKPAVAEAAKPAVAEVATSAPAPSSPVALPTAELKAAETETACRDSSATATGTYAIEVGEFIGKNALAKGKKAVKKAGLVPVVGPGGQKVEAMLRIQVGELTDEGAARKMLNKLQKAGADQFMLKDKGGTLRIYAGSYFEHQAALEEQKRLSRKGIRSELKEATVPVSTYVINAGCFPTEQAAKEKLAELERLGLKGKVLPPQ